MARVVRKPGPGQEQLRFLLTGLDTNKKGQVGWFESAKYGDKKATPIAYVASIHEFGYPEGGIKPRPFFRPTIAKQKENWRNLVISGALAILAGRETMDTVLEKLGMQASGDVAKTITQLQEPALKEATVKARARRKASGKITKTLRKPLVDSGIMLSTLSWAVGNETPTAWGG